MNWIDKLDALQKRFEDISARIASPKTDVSDKAYKTLIKDYRKLEQIITLYEAYKKTLQQAQEAEHIIRTTGDVAFKHMAEFEKEQLGKQRESIASQLKRLLLPEDPNDSKNSVVELRAGTGGDEAALWVGDLFRMYQRFSERMRWDLKIVDYTEGASGGYKEVICTVSGKQAYGTLKYESGVHRVQRVPATETQGRLHTSAATVVVLPEVDALSINIDMKDVRKDTFCSSGPGGQSVNTTYSAVRVTHLPTGIVASCQDEKSQLKNFDKAMTVLRARLYERAMAQQQKEQSQKRKSMVRSGDRSDKIRTYNYQRASVVDHRINYTTHDLSAVLDGKLDDLIEALRVADSTARLQEESV